MSAKSPAIQSRLPRVAIVDGARSPFVRSFGSFNDVDPVELSTHVARELLYRNQVAADEVDQVIWGTVISVVRSPNVAREVALNLNMYSTPGFTVNRACATGFQAVANAAQMIRCGEAEVVLAGGVDMASAAPITYKKRFVDILQRAQRAKGAALLTTLAGVKIKDLVPTPPALTERYTGLTMGQHAEEMAQYFGIERSEQESMAIASHTKASQAVAAGHIDAQMIPVPTKKGLITKDDLIRDKMDPAKLARLRPAFDRKHGTITAATSSALTDGASCVLVMSEEKAKALGCEPLGYVRSYDFPALDPRENMLLGNVYSVPGALEKAGVTLKDMDLVEIHEAFAAQVLCNLRCFEDAEFFAEKLNRNEPIGPVDPEKLNVWGGSMAYGHPFAATGGRILVNILHALKHVDGQLGVATACAAGGLGAAMVVERAS